MSEKEALDTLTLEFIKNKLASQEMDGEEVFQKLLKENNEMKIMYEIMLKNKIKEAKAKNVLMEIVVEVAKEEERSKTKLQRLMQTRR